jgi:hypothetical protein
MVSIETKHPAGWVMFPTGMTPRYIEFYDALEYMSVPGECGRARLGGPDCDSNRDMAVEGFLQMPSSKYDWMLFLDDDNPPSQTLCMDMLDVLYANPEIDALSGLYVKKMPPFDTVVYEPFDTPDPEHFKRLDLWNLDPEKQPLVRIAASGAGALMVRRRVFETIPKPWFQPNRPYHGGDMGLGLKMHKHGLKLFLDVRRTLQHLMVCSVQPKWDAERKVWEIEIDMGGNRFRLDHNVFRGGPVG